MARKPNLLRGVLKTLSALDKLGKAAERERKKLERQRELDARRHNREVLKEKKAKDKQQEIFEKQQEQLRREEIVRFIAESKQAHTERCAERSALVSKFMRNEMK